jgi:hypothetical protein
VIQGACCSGGSKWQWKKYNKLSRRNHENAHFTEIQAVQQDVGIFYIAIFLAGVHGRLKWQVGLTD